MRHKAGIRSDTAETHIGMIIEIQMTKAMRWKMMTWQLIVTTLKNEKDLTKS